VNRTIDTSTAEQRLVGSVDNGIDLKLRDIPHADMYPVEKFNHHCS
jgi:hypothetical protein